MKSDSYLARKRTGANSDTLVAKYAAYELYFRKYFRTSYIPSYVVHTTLYESTKVLSKVQLEILSYESTFVLSYGSTRTTRYVMLRVHVHSYIRKTFGSTKIDTFVLSKSTFVRTKVLSNVLSKVLPEVQLLP